LKSIKVHTTPLSLPHLIGIEI
jgi:hypothetical protein